MAYSIMAEYTLPTRPRPPGAVPLHSSRAPHKEMQGPRHSLWSCYPAQFTTGELLQPRSNFTCSSVNRASSPQLAWHDKQFQGELARFTAGTCFSTWDHFQLYTQFQVDRTGSSPVQLHQHVKDCGHHLKFVCCIPFWPPACLA